MLAVHERVDEAAGILTLTLNRPERLNALNPETFDAIEVGLRRATENPAVRVVVLTGAGRAFCAGGDVGDLSTRAVQPDTSFKSMQRFHQIPDALAHCSKVTIARINGAAVGAGLALALACDYRIAARSAVLSTGFIQAGLTTDCGMSFLLPRAVGFDRAKDLLLTGRRVDAAEAHGIGLVTHLVDDAGLDACVASVASAFPPELTTARGMVKQTLHAASTLTLREALALEAAHQAIALHGADHRAAMERAVRRRKS